MVCKYNNASISNSTVTIYLHRTVGGSSDLVTSTFTTPASLSGVSYTAAIMALPPVVYATNNATDVIELWGALTAKPTVNSLDVIQASIIAVKLF